jgi:quinohemoprotein ethanol dehydrogenase
MTNPFFKTTLASIVLAFAWQTPSAHDMNDTAGERFNWSSHDATPDETAYSPMGLINPKNVNRLGLVWSLDLPGERSLQATPLAIDRVLYFTGSYSAVYAVDARTGKLLWKHDPEVWKHDPAKMRFTLPVNRGVAYSDGRIFSGTLDGRLQALDAKTGKQLWSVPTVSVDSMQTINGAPRVFNGKVIIGNSGSDFGARGYVTAFDAASGQQLWRFYTAPGTAQQNAGDPIMERAAATWDGEYWKSGTGGAVWDSITFDRELNRIYIGTGNGPYDPNESNPSHADHLFVASIVALDADTGKYLWHYQTTPRDAWDFDATQQMILADLVILGERREVLMQAPKNGFFYVLDRRDGKLISAQKTGRVTWAERIDLASGRPVEASDAHYGTGEAVVWPGPLGSHSVQTMSFSPKTGLVYLPYMRLGVRYSRNTTESDGFLLADLSVSSVEGDPGRAKGALLAWDPVEQKARWSVPLDTIWNGGTLATGGGLVFQGTADGYFSAYDAALGQQLWRFNAGLGINAAPISYSIRGQQYVSVLVGYGGSAAVWGMNVGWKFNAQPRRLLTFALDGKASLPATPGSDLSVKALDDPSLQLNEADVRAGHALFMQCAICHGLNLNSTGSPAPDLRESAIALRLDSLWTLLQQGTLLSSGMPRFDTLSEQQVRQIHAYIRAGARKALATPKAQTVATPASQ